MIGLIFALFYGKIIDTKLFRILHKLKNPSYSYHMLCLYIQFVKKNLGTEEKNVKCYLHSRSPITKSLHTFLFLHTFYNCTGLRQQKKFTQYIKCQRNLCILNEDNKK